MKYTFEQKLKWVKDYMTKVVSPARVTTTSAGVEELLEDELEDELADELDEELDDEAALELEVPWLVLL